MVVSVTGFTTFEKQGVFEGFKGNARGIKTLAKIQQRRRIITQSSICSCGFCCLDDLVRQWPEFALCHAI